MPKVSQPDKEAKEKVYIWIAAYQENGDQDAQYNLVVHYKNLVESIARKYSQGKSFHEDLVQVGNIGLLGAIRRYDATFGKSFEAFAVPTIVGEIKRFLRDKTWSVHVPRRIKELGPKIKNAVEELTRELQSSPQISDIADFIGVTEEEVLEAMEMGKSYQALSVDHSIEADSDGSTITLLDVVGGTDDGFERVNQRMLLEKVLPVLDEREQKILQFTFIENRSQKETGELLDISQMHVSRIQRQAIKKLREALQNEEEE
ncbi:TPA: RNA polymerase sigma factor SigB [Listeria monocytogenes]|nr:RNA polymerase sigma factor SigB [Listeria monocytogenes]MCB2703101.1 RNA polymerase sigma factor SigB [Listeria monocytogenes]MCB2712063.1 RNA polymerase sigma factor SigB [Listeria monocytogenes]MCB2724214.1 RNA polymerase sigma factor SigB [Listeria monocytogenes]MCB2730319.1 RNA polymerase sigma factor SigB [Listeria monocytogenes]